MILPIGKLKNLVEEAVDYRETPAVDAVFAAIDEVYAHIKELNHAIAYEEGVKARRDDSRPPSVVLEDLHQGFVRRTRSEDYIAQMLDEDNRLKEDRE